MANRIIWITGASTGIGAALARKMASTGDTVAISARSAETLASVCAENPDRLHPFPVDVTDCAAVAAAIEAIETTLGPIAQAVLNAGAYTKTPVEGFSAATVEQMMQVNVVGVANALEALMPRMVARRRGAIALMASVAGYRGLPYAAGYSGSKAAVISE